MPWTGIPWASVEFNLNYSAYCGFGQWLMNWWINRSISLQELASHNYPYEYEPPTSVGHQCTALLQAMLSMDPTKRISMTVCDYKAASALYIWFELTMVQPRQQKFTFCGVSGCWSSNEMVSKGNCAIFRIWIYQIILPCRRSYRIHGWKTRVMGRRNGHMILKVWMKHQGNVFVNAKVLIDALHWLSFCCLKHHLILVHLTSKFLFPDAIFWFILLVIHRSLL